MPTQQEMNEYHKKLDVYYRKKRAYKALRITTPIFTGLWIAGGCAWFLYWVFTSFTQTHQMKQVFMILTYLGMCIACACVITIGVFIIVHCIRGLDSYTYELSLGIFGIIFTGIIPGVLYIVTHVLYENAYSVEQPTHPQELENARKRAQAAAEKAKKRREREARDPRNYFTQDDDDVGEVPDINRIDFKDLKRAMREEDADKDEA